MCNRWGQLCTIMFNAALCVCFIVCVQELELVEDVWRGEAQDLLSQIAQLQEENKSLLTNMSNKDPMSEEDLQRHEGEDVCSQYTHAHTHTDTQKDQFMHSKCKELVNVNHYLVRRQDNISDFYKSLYEL